MKPEVKAMLYATWITAVVLNLLYQTRQDRWTNPPHSSVTDSNGWQFSGGAPSAWAFLGLAPTAESLLGPRPSDVGYKPRH